MHLVWILTQEGLGRRSSKIFFCLRRVPFFLGGTSRESSPQSLTTEKTFLVRLHASKHEKVNAALNFFFSRVKVVREKIRRSSKIFFCLRRVPFFWGDISRSFTGNTDHQEKRKTLFVRLHACKHEKVNAALNSFFRESELSVRKSEGPQKIFFCLRRVPSFFGNLSRIFTAITDHREKLFWSDCMQANTKK
jgi:hypothetical protein